MTDLVGCVFEYVGNGALAPSAALEILRRHYAAVSDTKLHPLVQRNVSSLTEQRFSARWNGEEFFLRDHVIGGKRVLPGVAYLEMARAAVQESVEEGEEVLELGEVMWLKPLAVEQEVEVRIGLYEEGEGEIGYEIYRVESKEGGEEEEEVYGRGRVKVGRREEGAEGRVEVERLRGKCERRIEVGRCYEEFAKRGVRYGEGHRGLEEVEVGTDENGKRFVWARVGVPKAVEGTKEEYEWHPSVLDAALQAGVGLVLGAEGEEAAEGGMSVPFGVERVEVKGKVGERAYAWVRESADSGERVRKLDVDVCDEAGVVSLRLRGFMARKLEASQERDRAEEPEVSTVLWVPKRVAEAVRGEGGREGEAEGYAERWVVFCGLGAERQRIEAIYKESQAALAGGTSPTPRCVAAFSDSSDLDTAFGECAETVLQAIQQILNGKPREPVLLQVLAPVEGEAGLLQGLRGVLRTASLEQPKLKTQLIGLSADDGVHEVVRNLEENRGAARAGEVIEYERGERSVWSWVEAEIGEEQAFPWRAGGVYVITGGLGGLGVIFAREIAERAAGAKVILLGRSRLGEARERQLWSLEKSGATVEYREVDVGDRAAVEGCVAQIKERHGAVNGVLHGAGVIRDGFLMKKGVEEWREVLRAKVSGTVNLDEATKGEALDFFIMFGSLAGVFGNMGQGDYALGNAFMDRYAEYREGLVKAGRRSGRSLTVDWPAWTEGGMRIGPSALERMQKAGLSFLPTSQGLTAFYRACGMPGSQVVVLAKCRQTPRIAAARAAVEQTDERKRLPNDELNERAKQYLKSRLAGTLKLPVERIEAGAELEKYGIDSILAMKLVTELEKVFGPLSKTLLFEYRSIEELAKYFLESHREELEKRLGAKTAQRREHEADPVAQIEKPEQAKGAERRARRSGGWAAEASRGQERGRASAAGGGIAIVGLAGRYPKAWDVEEFWERLKGGEDCITEIPKERWDHREYFDPQKGKLHKTYSKWGGFIEGVAEFDPLFFNISPREAQILDPQERLFLQCVYGAMEDAGYTREGLKKGTKGEPGRVGVFVGVMYEEYQLYGAQAQATGKGYALGGNPSSIANRVSYFCDFHGPSLAVDTMCSSSLTALHLASESLLQGECEVAVAGGVNVSIHPNKYLGLAQGQFASSKGRCESFGVGGDGYVPGEGVGAVLLKRLERAKEDGDQIYGVLKGTSINHGGKTNGYTVPNPQAQGQVILEALKKAGVDARTVGYIEAHGTGTSLGDPIEIAGLSKAFGEYTKEKGFCAIGSAKSNIGHCESAAGIAGLTKVLLQLKHRRLVASLHAEELNPHIDFGSSAFVVQREEGEWRRRTVEGKEYPRRAGISSFGAGGSNAHVIVEEHVEEHVEEEGREEREAQGVERIVVLSAKSEERLKERAKALAEWIERGKYEEQDFERIAYTLQVGREEMEQRLGLLARSVQEVAQKLRRYAAGEEGIEDVCRAEAKKGKEWMAVLGADEDLQGAIEAWVKKGKQRKLLEAWVRGLGVDWRKLYDERRPKRISLPTYPFARERYWVTPVAADDRSPTAHAHPLVQTNHSDLSGVRFGTALVGDEPYCRDRDGVRVLPSIVLVEMAREAVERARGAPAGDSSEPRSGLRFRDLVFESSPPVGESAAELRIAVAAARDSQFDFEIYTDAKLANGASAAGRRIHCRGRAEPIDAVAVSATDLPELRARCTAEVSLDLDDDTRRESHERGGHTLADLRLGQDGACDCGVARFEVSAGASGEPARFVAHPLSLLAAVQAAAGLDAASAGAVPARSWAVARTIELLELAGNPVTSGFIHVRRREGRSAASSAVDLDVLDASGRPCLRAVNLTLAPQDAGETAAPVSGARRADEPQMAASGGTAPRTQLERTIAQVWEETLGVRGIGVDDSVLELGADSITSARVAKRLREVFQVDVPVASVVMTRPTVEGLAIAVVAELARQQDARVAAES